LEYDKKKNNNRKYEIPTNVTKGEIALDYTDYLIESFEHFALGNINAFPQSKLTILEKILNPEDDSENSEAKHNNDYHELNFMLGNTTRNSIQDYTAQFKKSLITSPMTSSPIQNLSEESIIKFYQLLFEDDNFLTMEMAEKPDNFPPPENELVYALYPTLLFFPADPFMCIAADPVDMIYYTNRMLTTKSGSLQSSTYLIYRLFFMMSELTDGIHINKDLALASEFAELIPDDAFQIENIFVAEHIITFMKYLYYSDGAAVDEYKLFRYQKLLNTDQQEMAEEENPNQNDPKKEVPRGKWLIDTMRNIMYSQIEGTSFDFIFLYMYDN